MDKVKNLQEKASILRSILEQYANIDSNAEAVLRLMNPLFVQIEAGEIIPPHEHQFRWYFASTESPLFIYDDLCEAAAEYAKALEDWNNSLPFAPWHTSNLP
ncbi:MAG TPA: hypothetical protein VJ654_17130 [Noviherbaspirillum sp.]|nr:hypothetical protein [Noviherbaspirillum sp.]